MWLAYAGADIAIPFTDLRSTYGCKGALEEMRSDDQWIEKPQAFRKMPLLMELFSLKRKNAPMKMKISAPGRLRHANKLVTGQF